MTTAEAGSRGRLALLVGAPVVAIATVGAALRIGAASAERAAIVHGAPPPASGHGAAWQLRTILDDRGVREPIAIDGISAEFRAHGATWRWTGASNVDGVAEMVVPDAVIADGDTVDLVVRAPNDPRPLAEGRVVVPAAAGRGAWASGVGTSEAWARPARRDGDVKIDVAIYGGRMAPSFSSAVWLRVTDAATGAPLDGVRIDVEPEAGVSVDRAPETSCAAGWTSLEMTAAGLAAGATFRATAKSGAHGSWFGQLPTAPGGTFVRAPTHVRAGAPVHVDVTAPGVRPVTYLEVDDTRGRDFAAVLRFAATDVGGGAPHGGVDLPPLENGLHWIVAAGDPAGAEHLGGATIARPIWVGDAPGGAVDGPPACGANGDGKGAAGECGASCAFGGWLARTPAGPFERWVALDGLAGRRRGDASRRAIGRGIAAGAIAVAAAIDALLIVAGARRARRDLARIVDAEGDVVDAGGGARGVTGAARVVVGVLVALLGFALLAALILDRA